MRERNRLGRGADQLDRSPVVGKSGSGMSHAEFDRGGGETGVERPERVAGEPGGDKELHVVPANAATVKRVCFDKIEAFLGGAGFSSRQAAECGQRLGAFGEIAGGQLAEHHGVDGDLSTGQRRGEVGQSAPEVLHPHRGVCEDHLRRFASERRRGGTASAGMVPPRAARRRAASRSINASSPIRTSAVFSDSPVYSPACASRESSMFNVVLMHPLMPASDAWVKEWTNGSSRCCIILFRGLGLFIPAEQT